MKRSVYIIVISILLFSCKNLDKQEETKPITKDIVELVYASANVVSENSYHSRSSRSGIIEEILIAKGDQVKKGQILFRVTATADAKNRLKNAALNLEEARDNLFGNNNKLANIEVQLDRLEDQNKIDSINYRRAQRLWDQNIGTKRELEMSELAYQASSTSLKALRLELHQIQLSLKNNYEKAQNLVSSERSLLGDLDIKSEIDGKVFNVFKETGEYISPQENFAAIGSDDAYLIELKIDEVDISKIELGDTAIIQLEAYPDQVYASTLSYISGIKDEATQTFEVEAIFVQSPPRLFNGLSGEANIIVGRRKNAVVIPSEYLINGNQVQTSDGSKELTIGIKNLEYVEVIAGIDTATVLLKPVIE